MTAQPPPAKPSVRLVREQRRALRNALHARLDEYLRANTKAPDGSDVTVLDDIVMRVAFGGYGWQLSLHVVEPEAVRRERERLNAEAEAAQRQAATPQLLDTAQRALADLTADKPKLTVMP